MEEKAGVVVDESVGKEKGVDVNDVGKENVVYKRKILLISKEANEHANYHIQES